MVVSGISGQDGCICTGVAASGHASRNTGSVVIPVCREHRPHTSVSDSNPPYCLMHCIGGKLQLSAEVLPLGGGIQRRLIPDTASSLPTFMTLRTTTSRSFRPTRLFVLPHCPPWIAYFPRIPRSSRQSAEAFTCSAIPTKREQANAARHEIVPLWLSLCEAWRMGLLCGSTYGSRVRSVASVVDVLIRWPVLCPAEVSRSPGPDESYREQRQ
jgi:hypothetical protein